MTRIAVLVSGGGTNLQTLIDAESRGELGDGKIVLVLSSSDKAYALERAKRAGIETVIIRRRDCENDDRFDRKVEETLAGRQIGLVVLAGYLSILGLRTLSRYEGRIINVHPSLIPSFCGKGFYGLRVHEVALNYGVKVTGATVHLVSEVVDGGKILLQKAVNVEEGDTPETLQRRVMEQAEWELLPRAVAMLCNKAITERGTENG